MRRLARMSHVVAGMQVLEQRKHSSAAMETLLGAVDTLLSSTGAELLSRERCELNRQLLRQPGAALVSALSASIVCLVGEHFHALVCSSPYQRVVVCTLAGAAWELVGWLLTEGRQLVWRHMQRHCYMHAVRPQLSTAAAVQRDPLWLSLLRRFSCQVGR